MKKVLLYIALGIGAFFLLAWAVAEFSEGWVKSKLQEKVSNATEGRLYFDVDKIDIELFSPALYAYGVSFRDTTQGKPVIKLQLDTFLIKGIDWTSIPADGPVYFEQLSMSSVQLTIEAQDTAQFRNYFKSLGQSRNKKPALRPKDWNLNNASADVSFGNNLWKVINLTAAGTYSDTLTQGIGFLQHLNGVNVVEIEAYADQEHWLYASRLSFRRDSLFARVKFDSLHVLPKQTQFQLAFGELGISGRLPMGKAKDAPFLIDTLLADQFSILELPPLSTTGGKGQQKKAFPGLQINTLALPSISIQTQELRADLDLQGKQLKINPKDSIPLHIAFLQLKGQNITYKKATDSLQLQELLLLAKDDTLNQLDVTKLAVNQNQLHIQAEQLQFSQAPFSRWFNKDYSLEKAYASNVTIRGQLPSQKGQQQNSTEEGADINLRVGELDLNQLNAELSTGTGSFLSFDQGNVHIAELRKEKAWEWSRLQLAATNIRFNGKKAASNLRVSEFSLNDQTAIVRRMQLGKPNPLQQPDATFYLDVPHIKVSGWQVNRLLNDQKVFIQSINALRPTIAGATDKSSDKHQEKEKEKKPFIIKSLLELPIKGYIGELQLYDGLIRYKERMNKEDTAGVLVFSKVNAGLTNLTNLPYKIRQNSTLQLDFQAQLMKAAPSQTRIWFDLSSPNYAFQAVGGVDSLQVEELNPITAYVSPVLFDEGMLYKSRWQLDGDAEKTSGKIWLEYDNLNVELTPKNSANTSGVFREIGEFILQKGFLDEERSIYNPVSFSNEADPTRSFINYYWRSILAGLKKAIDAPGSGG